MTKKFTILIHGGAGKISKDLSREEQQAYLEGLKASLISAYEAMVKNDNSLDSVSKAVVSLENNPLFNAGKGAVYTHNSTHELDASIMDGEGRCGAACSLKEVKNPILLARLIMEKSEHVFLGGKGAEEFAKLHKLEMVANSHFNTKKRLEQLAKALKMNKSVLDHEISEEEIKAMKSGTVGAVAINSKGELAAATSTGGMTNKRYGRIGDSPIIGAGTFANNNSCAISCTGVGEEFIRYSVAHDIHALMSYANYSLKEAVDNLLFEKLAKGDGGLIAIDKDYNFTMNFNSAGMLRGMINERGEGVVGIWEELERFQIRC